MEIMRDMPKLRKNAYMGCSWLFTEKRDGYI